MKMQRWGCVFGLLLIFGFSSIDFVLTRENPDEPPACSAADRAILLSFKAGITEDTSGVLSWWIGTECCAWEGIQCNPGGRVTALQIQRLHDEPGVYMKGTLSSSLGRLPFLEVFMLSGLKQITGTIPESYTKVLTLRVLALENMMLQGSIPTGLGRLRLLQALSLSGNRFQGQLPPSLGSLANLIQMNFGGNFLTGTIPDTYKSLQKLQYMDLSHNLVSGVIPSFVGQLQSLAYLDLSYNKFASTIPSSLCNLYKAGVIDLSHNTFTGEIPKEIGNLKSLSVLSLANNRLTGPIPASVAKLSQLSSLNLSSNMISGPLPVALAKGVPQLLSLDLSYNRLTLNGFPDWLRTRKFYDLHVAGCNIKGNLPNFTQPENFHSIDLSDNHLTGAIGSYFARMSNLQFIKLSNNMLGSDVSVIDLPYGITSLDLHANVLYGSISELLQNVPRSFIKVVDLSSNKITGTIPSSISNMTTLEKLNLSRNQITGTIPVSLGKLATLEWLDLSINRLTGKIPNSLLGLKKLRHMNLRANRLCGQIPQGRPFNIFPKVAYAHNQCLCGKPLPLCKSSG